MVKANGESMHPAMMMQVIVSGWLVVRGNSLKQVSNGQGCQILREILSTITGKLAFPKS